MNKSKEQIEESYKRKNFVDEYDSVRFLRFGDKLRHVQEVDAVNQAISEFSKKNGRKPRILDLGIGTGRISRNLRGYFSGAGLDSSQVMLEKSKSFLPDWKLIQGNLFDTGLDSGSIDLIINFRVIRHFQKEDRMKAYSEVRRVLSDNGFFVIDVLNRDRGFLGNLFDFFYINLRKLLGAKVGIYDELYTRKEFLRELSENGFSPVFLKSVGSYYWLWYPLTSLSRFKFLGRLFESLFFSFARGFEKRGSKKPFSWVACLRKK